MLRISLPPADLEAFLSVAETGSFSRCGKILGLSQPAVTARIQHLEEVLGVPLFHRTTRRVELTTAGERLRSRVAHTMQELRGLLLEFDDEAHLRRGRINIGASATVSAGFLAAAITNFHAKRPQVEISLFDDFFGRAMDRLARGEVDFAVLPHDAQDEMFLFETLFRDPFVLAVSAQHVLAKHRTVALSELKRETFLTVAPHSPSWELFMKECIADRIEFRSALQTRNPFAVLSMIKAGFGVGFLPKMLTETLNLEGVVLVQMKEADLSRDIGIVTPKGRALPPAATAFLISLREAAAAQQSNIDQVRLLKPRGAKLAKEAHAVKPKRPRTSRQPRALN